MSTAPPRPAHNALRITDLLSVPARGDRWASRLLPPRPSYPHSRHVSDPSNTVGVLGHSPLFRQPPNVLPQQPPAPASFSGPAAGSCRQLRNCLEGKRKESSVKERPGQPQGLSRPPGTLSVQGLQRQTPCTHQANCLQSKALAPGEPSRTRSHSHSRHPMAQVGSPSSCQTEARDLGVPVVLQRPPTSQPLCSHPRPRGAHVACPKVATAQTPASALLQPASSRARSALLSSLTDSGQKLKAASQV